jgi:hypothetical protein
MKMKTMKLAQLLIFVLFAKTFFACNGHDMWQKVQYDKSLATKKLVTHCVSDGQIWQKAQVYFERDTLIIAFPPQLPAYSEDVTIKVYDGKFQAVISGEPFEPMTITFKTLQQHLQLDKRQYAIGDTLSAACDIVFHYTSTFFHYTSTFDTENDSIVQGEFSFKGTICEIVREQDFDPFDEKNFMTFDLPTVLRELGEPLNREKFNTLNLSEFRVELENHLDWDKFIWIEELTWDVSPMRDISDEGKERLTIWYYQKDGIRWLPVHFLRWNSDMQF